MKNLKKSISLLFSLILCCTCLTGCISEIGRVEVNPDGSGNISMQFGFTDEALETIVAVGTDPSEIAHYRPFEYNGITYYGDTITQKFSTVNEFNDIMNGNIGDVVEESELIGGTGAFNLSKNEDGIFVLKLNTENTEDINLDGYSPEEMDMLMEDMQLLFTIYFPSNVNQIEGNTEGIVIKGNTLILDFMKMSENLSELYTFVTNDLNDDIVFTDIIENYWGKPAIYSLAYGGLVDGVGDNKFNPEGILTRAEFYQILARVLGIEVGEVDGYWAYKAIENCIENGFVLNLIDKGDYAIVSENWDIPIHREEAVAAMVKAVNSLTLSLDNDKNLSFEDISDYSEIDGIYADLIVDAFNMGVINGVDSEYTFNPKGFLTRAQGCQLFYNLNWCSVLEYKG